MKFSIKAIIVVMSIGWSGCSHPLPDRQPVSIAGLLKEMTDPVSATYFPEPAYKSMQVSSYDRLETTANDSAGWFANKDYDNYIRIEKNRSDSEYVLMDAKGPGAITRWWIPLEEGLKDRILRIYIDNDSIPAIEENYHDFMQGNSRIKWPFAFTASDEKDSASQVGLPPGFKQMSADVYMPLTFAKSCKVTVDRATFYYVIDYRSYPAGTIVVPYTKKTFQDSQTAIDSAANSLLHASAANSDALKKAQTIRPHQTLELELPEGSHAISDLRLKINSAKNKQMNRSAVMMISFDGQQTVWSPVAEFFGGGVYAGAVKNSRLEVDADGAMHCSWSMPYRKNASIILKNYGDEDISAELSLSVKNYEWRPTSMYFHADWHEQAPLNAPPFKDWNYLKVEGKGRYAGDVLTVYAVPKGWWGEGDEKIYIDQDTFPDHLGTGLEDYYGYAWGMAHFFNSPFISMPLRDARGKADWSGYNTMARIRLLDDIVFNTSLRHDIEAWIVKAPVSFSVCTFWYGMPGATGNIHPDEASVVRKLPDFSTAKEK